MYFENGKNISSAITLVTLNGKKKTKNNFCVLTKYDKERLGKILPREFSLEYLINDLKKERVNKPTFLRYGFDSVMRGKLEDQQKMIINKVVMCSILMLT